MTPKTFGFADSHGTLLTYCSLADHAAAHDYAQHKANQRGERIEYWEDGRDDDSSSVDPDACASELGGSP